MPNRAIGLNISDRELQIVEVRDTPDGKKIVKALRRQFLDDENLLHLILELLPISQVQEKVIVAAAPHSEVLLRHLAVPFKEQKKISQMIRYEVKPQIPFPIEEVVVDFYDMESGREEEADLIVAVVQEDVLRKRFELLRRLGLNVQIMDIENFALFTAYLYSNAFIPEGKVLLIDVSKERSLVDITDGERLIWTRTIHKKKEYLEEIDITLTSFLEKGKDAEIKKAVLGGSLKEEELLRIRTHIEGHLKLPVEVFEFREKIQDSENLLRECGGVRSNVIPIGLALRGLDTRRLGVNFAGEGGIRKVRLRRLKRSLVSTAFLAGFILLVLAVSIFGKLFIVKKTLSQYKVRAREVFSKTLPEVKGIVNEETQIKDALKRLEKRSLALLRFTRARPDGLEVFREVSLRIAPRLKLDIEELLIAQDSVAIRGLASSLDMVNGLKRELSASRYFKNIKVDLSKGSASGKAVGFKLTMDLIGGEE